LIRLFVALEIPEAVRSRLFLLQGGVPGARWTTPDQMHLTLRFIGEVNEAVADDIDGALTGLRAPSFPLELAGVGEFGGNLPRALWAGVRPSRELHHLQKKVETAMQRLGLSPEERKFTPHVTLARLKNAPREKVMDFLSHYGLFASGPFEVTRFALFSSRLGGAGAVYNVERTYGLGPLS
jgi:2'-5' RNA ligase